ncbi:unnamed protein product, partial [Laminaria digitata]
SLPPEHHHRLLLSLAGKMHQCTRKVNNLRSVHIFIFRWFLLRSPRSILFNSSHRNMKNKVRTRFTLSRLFVFFVLQFPSSILFNSSRRSTRQKPISRHFFSCLFILCCASPDRSCPLHRLRLNTKPST